MPAEAGGETGSGCDAASGQCGTTCQSGTTRCVGNDSQTCSAASAWEDAGACPVGCASPTSTSCLTVTAIAAGASHTCALLSDTTVKCWGLNGNGQLGDGTTTARSAPVAVSGLTGVTGISAGTAHTCALLKAGTVECWGSNSTGQLGDGTTADRHAPVPAASLTGVTQVAAGSANTCAITPANIDSTVQCWGANGSSFFSNSAPNPAPTPAPAGTLNGVSQVSVGDGFLCGIDPIHDYTDCMGINGSGQLGDGATSPYFGVPNMVDTAGNGALMYATAVSVGTESLGGCALVPSQTPGQPNGVYCWGDNTAGQLGNNTSGGQSLYAAPVSTISGVTAVSVGEQHACALLQGGTVQCWGDGSYGDLGLGSSVPSHVPVAVPGLSGVSAISLGNLHSCALLTAGAKRRVLGVQRRRRARQRDDRERFFAHARHVVRHVGSRSPPLAA